MCAPFALIDQHLYRVGIHPPPRRFPTIFKRVPILRESIAVPLRAVICPLSFPLITPLRKQNVNYIIHNHRDPRLLDDFSGLDISIIRGKRCLHHRVNVLRDMTARLSFSSTMSTDRVIARDRPRRTLNESSQSARRDLFRRVFALATIANRRSDIVRRFGVTHEETRGQPRAFFFAGDRFNWMSLLRRALLPGRFRSLLLLRWRVALSSPCSLLSALLRSLTRPIRSYIYCIEETRAAAFLAHAPPVMSGLQSCLSFRPSVQRTGRLPCPLLAIPSRSPRRRSLPLTCPLRRAHRFSTAILRSLARSAPSRYSISPPSIGTFARRSRCTANRSQLPCKIIHLTRSTFSPVENPLG